MSESLEALSAADETTLLRLARHVLERAVRDGVRSFPDSDLGAFGLTEPLRRPGGVFVTYHRRGRLRGCIGSIIPVESLYRAVVSNALHSAFHDPRFQPVSAGELVEIHIEISVMSPLEEVADPRRVRVGRDGLVLQAAGHTGVFLPQVPVECGWDLETYLRELGNKAGLDEGAVFRKDARLQRFTAQVFSEA